MARPQTRLPRAEPTPSSGIAEPEVLKPAPDNGRPYGEHAPATEEPAKLRTSPRHLGRQLGLRVPVKLWDRLQACSQETGISKTSLLVHALDAELRSRGH